MSAADDDFENVEGGAAGGGGAGGGGGSGGEDDPEDEEFYIFYRDRVEWTDVEPIHQDDGPDPVVQIDYSAKFEDVYNYFRGVLQSGEKSERVLSLTADAITLNAANYTVWQYRRDVLEHLGVPCLMTEKGLSEEFDKEFEFSRSMIEENQKNYQVWHHRKILVSWASGYDENTGTKRLECVESCKKLVRQEVELTKKVLRKDAKNYHAWQHRQWVLYTFKDFGDELSYVNLLISMDVRNNSAWNQRYFVISNSPFSKDTLNSELEYTWANAEVAMLNESPWNYLRGILRLYKKLDDPGLSVEACNTCLRRCLEMQEKGVKSYPMFSFLLELMEARLGTEGGTTDLYLKALQICDDLVELDKIRKNFWTHEKKSFATMYGEKYGAVSSK